MAIDSRPATAGLGSSGANAIGIGGDDAGGASICDSKVGAHPAAIRSIATVSINNSFALSNICFCLLDVGFGLVAD